MTATLTPGSTDPNALQANHPHDVEASEEPQRPPYVSVSTDIGGTTWTIGAVLHGADVTEADVAEALVESAFAVAGLGGASRYAALQAAIAQHGAPPATPAPELDEREAPIEPPAQAEEQRVDPEPEPGPVEPEVEQSEPEAPEAEQPTASGRRRVRRDLGDPEPGKK